MKPRPLSPHLQIYKPQISSVVSITHRMAGLALILGIAILGWWLMTAASGAVAYDAYFMQYARDMYGQAVLVILTWCFFFYFLGELRYIAWALGHGFSLPVMNATGWLVTIGSFVATALVWVL